MCWQRVSKKAEEGVSEESAVGVGCRKELAGKDKRGTIDSLSGGGGVNLPGSGPKAKKNPG